MAERLKTAAVGMAIAGLDICNFDSSSSSDSEERPRHLRDFVQEVVLSFDDDEFRSHFRISRSTCDLLVNVLGRHVSSQLTDERIFDVQKQLLMTLWTLATPDSYR